MSKNRKSIPQARMDAFMKNKLMRESWKKLNLNPDPIEYSLFWGPEFFYSAGWMDAVGWIIRYAGQKTDEDEKRGLSYGVSHRYHTAKAVSLVFGIRDRRDNDGLIFDCDLAAEREYCQCGPCIDRRERGGKSRMTVNTPKCDPMKASAFEEFCEDYSTYTKDIGSFDYGWEAAIKCMRDEEKRFFGDTS